MKMTIYVPDDLAEKVKEHADLNVSAVCQDALRRELVRRDELAKLDKGMERQVMYAEDRGRVAFLGKQVFYNDRYKISAYITRRHRIAISVRDELFQFDSFDDFINDPNWQGTDELTAALAQALGEEHVIELDI
jgi:post-segregation antitoxin (ccd killing protein)